MQLIKNKNQKETNGVGKELINGTDDNYGNWWSYCWWSKFNLWWARKAEIQQANDAAYRRWIQSNSQKTLSNAREQFQASYQYAQQLKKNDAIAKSAYSFQRDNKESLNDSTNFQQKELSDSLRNQKSSLLTSFALRGISSNSGMYGTLAAMQAISGLTNAVQLEKNRLAQAKNIDNQTQNMLSQQTENIFMPNIQMYDEAPILGDANAAATGGIVSGMLQIGAGVAGAATSFSGNPTPTFIPGMGPH